MAGSIIASRLLLLPAVAAMAAALLFIASAADAQPPKVRVALSASLTGAGAITGQAMVNAATLAAEEAVGASPDFAIELSIHDDQSTEEGARMAAQAAIAEGSVAVVGPALTVGALAAGPLYAQAGLANVVATAHGE